MQSKENYNIYNIINLLEVKHGRNEQTDCLTETKSRKTFDTVMYNGIKFIFSTRGNNYKDLASKECLRVI